MTRVNALVFAAALSLVVGASAALGPARADVSFDFFYSNLSPHGSWLVSASYGRVWQPAVYEPGWNPYYDGSWEYTDLGWTWVSDYAWGAIPYHYGTWVLDAQLGWVWVPGYVWAPSWVVFRVGPGTVGWAPVPPAFTVGVSLAAAEPPAAAFVFVPEREFSGHSVRRYAVSGSRAAAELRQTRIVGGPSIHGNVVVNRALSVSQVEQWSGRSIRPRPIERVPRAAPFREVTRASLAAPSPSGGRTIRAAQPHWEGAAAQRSQEKPGPDLHPRGGQKRHDQPEHHGHRKGA